MDNAKQHWKILQELGSDLQNRVRSFIVIGKSGEGVIVATKDGDGFWLGKMWYLFDEKKTVTKPTLLDFPGLVQMAHSDKHIVLLNKRGEIYTIGMNAWGNLTPTDLETRFVPQLISIPDKITSVRCSICHSLALTDNGKVWTWEWEQSGHFSPSSSTQFFPSPRQFLNLDSHRIVAVECGGFHSLALTDQGEVYIWGLYYWKEIDDGSKHIPIRIPTPSPVRSIAAGCWHNLLLTHTGEVYACGENGHGQLGLPTEIEYSSRLSKVEGLPPILQIASHSSANLSIAISSDRRCFVWGELREFDKFEEKLYIKISTPRELPPFYSTVESALSFFSTHRNTPHSILVSETFPSPLSDRMSRMFDNPETSDVQFVVEQRTIYAHRIILSNSSDYFVQMFSKRWLAHIDPDDPIIKMTILDHSYQVFHAFLRFLYTDCLEIYPKLLPELFELAIQYLVPDLQQLCLSRMRITLTPATYSLYCQLANRHSLLPELATFQQELVQFSSTRMSDVITTSAYLSMDANL